MAKNWTLKLSFKTFKAASKISNMKKLFFPVSFSLLLISCSEEEPISEACAFPEVDRSANLNFSAIIPIVGSESWTYTDSLWENGIFQAAEETNLEITKVYQLGNLAAIEFSSILPLLSIRNDTMYATRLNPGPKENACYELLYPMFFKASDSVQVDDDPSDKYVYPINEIINTPIGNFSQNVVYREADIFEVILNENAGVLRISFFVYNADGLRQKRRSLDLISYSVQ